MKTFISYKRVSTDKQGANGLGIQAQEAAVYNYIQSVGGVLIAEYKEVESGRNCERPELEKALSHARRSKATLIVAKLDRLSRNVAFLSALMEGNVPFVACDNPHATNFTLHILAAVAEHEAKMTSERTKAAMAVCKARGVRFGSAIPGFWQGTASDGTPMEEKRRQGLAKAHVVAARMKKEAARRAYLDILPIIREQKASGKSLQQIADHLNETGHTTRTGKRWNPMIVWRVLRREKMEKQPLS